METNVAVAWLAGIVVGALIGGFFAFAYGLQAGKKKSSGVTPSFYLSRDDMLGLVAHRIHEIVRVVRDRIPASRRNLRSAFSDDQLVHQSEFSNEYIRLHRWFASLRRPEVAAAVRRVTTPDEAVRINENV
jgi:hypothetical protein